MPWKETDAMNERIRYALAYDNGLYTITKLCKLYGISRPTAYKWMKRFDEGGVAALLPSSLPPLFPSATFFNYHP